MSYFVEATCICNRGSLRCNNEDNFFFNGTIRNEINSIEETSLEMKEAKSRLSYFAVFDGMGGEANGEFASFASAKSFMEIVNRASETPEKLCQIMNSAVCAEASNRKSRYMGTTVAMLSVDGEIAQSCNVGDSRVYLFRNRKLQQLSEDHVDYRRNGKKGSLTQYLGIPEDEMLIEPCIISTQICSGDVFLLCSDGLSDMVGDEEICAVLRENGDMERLSRMLIGKALENGGKDNTTLILLKIR